MSNSIIAIETERAPGPLGHYVQATEAAIVEGAGLSRDRIAKVTAYLVGVEHWPAFNAIYAEVLGDHRPARAVVPVPALHHGYLIELEAIAVR
jgi:2-iminobutanoate/2-iminopropanoate deaminase